MFSIFKPRKTIISLLEGGIDIHNHILPGIDDGAKTLAHSLELIATYDQYQIHHIVATPHIMAEHYPNTKDTIQNALALIQSELKKNNLEHIKIRAAAEYMMDSDFETLLDKRQLLTLVDNYVLVEISFFNPPIHLPEILYQLTLKGYTPVLAHPERYLYYHRDLSNYRKLKKQGCLLQLNALSLTSFYGTEVHKTAISLVEEGLIDLIASDVHNMNQIKEMAINTISQKNYMILKKVSDQTQELFK